MAEVRACLSARDRAIALVPFYAGARIAEITGLNIDDMTLAGRHSMLRLHGRGGKLREIPIHPQLRLALTDWLDERVDWPAADGRALFVNQRGQRLSVRAAHHIITAIAQTANLPDTTAHVLRHTFATRLVQGGTDLITVAELLGHTRIESTRVYDSRRPTRKDAINALKLLDVHQRS